MRIFELISPEYKELTPIDFYEIIKQAELNEKWSIYIY